MLLFFWIFSCNFRSDLLWDFALIADKVAKLLNFLTWSFIINHIKFSRNIAFLAVYFNWIDLCSYANRACHWPSISCLFVIPSFKALPMKKMCTESSYIDLLVQTNGTLIVGVWQIRANFVNFIIINVNVQLRWCLKGLWALLMILTSSIKNNETKDDERSKG